MIFNPIFSIVKFSVIFLLRQIKLRDDTIHKNIRLEAGNFTIFRHAEIKSKTDSKKSALLALRFRFEDTTIEKDIKRSFFQIPLFVGLPGFEAKLWTYDPEQDLFQGIYQWQSENHINKYLSSFAVEFVKNKAIYGSVTYEILKYSNMKDFLTTYL